MCSSTPAGSLFRCFHRSGLMTRLPYLPGVSRMKLSYLSFGAFALVLSACADDPIQPTAKFAPQFNQIVSESRHIVDFNGQVPKGFAVKVAPLGGSVVMTHGSGVVIVSGITPVDAA